jgi:hypothetical protein
MLQTHFKLAGPQKKKSKQFKKKKTCRTDPIEARDFIWLSGEGGDEGDLLHARRLSQLVYHSTWAISVLKLVCISRNAKISSTNPIMI